MKKKWVFLTVGLVIVGGVVIALAAARPWQKKGPKVRTEKVERGTLVSTVSCNGRIEAHRKVDLSANVPGQVTNLAVREGDTVRKGDFLLQIDRTSLQAQYDSSRGALDALFKERDVARASLEQAQLELDRAKVSLDSGLIAQSDYDRARTSLDSARASLEASDKRIDQARATMAGARDTLGKTTITAPIAGIVTRLAVEEGEVAVIGTMNNPGTVLLTISDLSEIEAVMEVDETDIPAIRLGQTSKITIDAYPNKEFSGDVTEVGSSPLQTTLGSATGSEAIKFEVKLRLKDPPPGLKPGLSVSATLTTGRKEDVLSVPLQALAIREKEGSRAKPGEKPKDEEGVFVVQAGKVKFTPLTTGMTGELSIEVTAGLKGGEEVVTGPFKTLRELKEDQTVLVDNTLPRAEQKESS
jgi:HlyD family secretion protein